MSDTESGDRVECRPANDPAVRLFIGAAMLLALGIYCVVDGYILQKYPYAPIGEDLNKWATWAFNIYLPWIALPIGAVLAVWGVLFLRRKAVADSEGIRYSYFSKEKLPWSSVTRLDARQLKKGILDLHYGEGKDSKKLRLDSWKIRDFRELVAFVERHVPEYKHVLS